MHIHIHTHTHTPTNTHTFAHGPTYTLHIHTWMVSTVPSCICCVSLCRASTRCPTRSCFGRPGGMGLPKPTCTHFRVCVC